MIEFTRPLAQRRVYIAQRNGKLIAKITYHGSFGSWIAHGYGLDLGGTNANPGVKCFDTLDRAKKAIIVAAGQ